MATFRITHSIHTKLRVMPLLLVTLAALAMISLPRAHAAEPGAPMFGISPAIGTDPHLRFTIEPGQSQSADVSIINRSDVPSSALSFIADAQTLAGGSFGVASVTAPRTGATLWVDFPDEVTPLEPGAEQIRTVSVEVPEGTPPGEYIVGMAVQEGPDTASPEPTDNVGVALNIVNRQAMAIMVEVPGERTSSLAIGEVSMKDGGSNSIIAIGLLNNGNTHLTPSGKVQVSTPDGQELLDVNVDFGRFFSHTTSAINLPVEGFLPTGTYVITAEMWDDEADIRTDAIEQQLVVEPRELPNGEQAATLANGGPVIKAPVSAQGEASNANSSSGSSLLLLLGVSLGVGVVVVAGGVTVVMLLQRRGTVGAA